MHGRPQQKGYRYSVSKPSQKTDEKNNNGGCSVLISSYAVGIEAPVERVFRSKPWNLL